MKIELAKKELKNLIKQVLIEQTGGNGPDGRDLIAPAIDPNNVLLNKIPQGMKEASLASATNSEQVAIDGDSVGENLATLNYETEEIQDGIREAVRNILNTIPTTLPEQTSEEWSENKISEILKKNIELSQYKDYFESAYLELTGGKTLTWR
jgi:hypothetical protein